MAQTLADLRTRVRRRLNDPDGAVWPDAEINDLLRQSYQDLAHAAHVFWDERYADNLPRGLSYTADFERAYLDFDFGRASYTYAVEMRQFTPEYLASGPGSYTSPFEAINGYLVGAPIPATSELPETVVAVDRVLWDSMSVTAVTPRDLERKDTRYQQTTGEVYAYMWQQDGVRTFRKVRVPAAQAGYTLTTGSWGALRSPADVSHDAASGTFGCARRIPGHHPIGPDMFGLPRRVSVDSKNVRIEHWREGRALTEATVESELPDFMNRVLEFDTIASCYARPGPGQDVTLAAMYQRRSMQMTARIQRRIARLKQARAGVLGGGDSRRGQAPPRPRMPWQYGQEVRS